MRKLLASMALLWMGFPSSTFGQSGGRELYLTKCSACHGSDGAGNTTIGRSMKLNDARPAILHMGDEQLRVLILRGQGKMPSNKKLDAEKLHDLTVFLRDLAAGNPETGRAVAEAQARPLPDVSRAFHDQCSACHGHDGVGWTTIGRGLKIPDLTSTAVQSRSADELTKTIREGKGRMPAYGKQFNPVQISQLVAHIRAFAKATSTESSQGTNSLAPATPAPNMLAAQTATPPNAISPHADPRGGIAPPNSRKDVNKREWEPKPAPAPVEKKTSTSARQLYMAKCSTCHSRDGSGAGTVGKSMNVPSLVSRQVLEQSDEALEEVIKNGVGKMPAYKRKFSFEQIDQLVGFIRQLAKK
jgi:mono/diheme cytochrome c family protein